MPPSSTTAMSAGARCVPLTVAVVKSDPLSAPPAFAPV
jgi:hypothetical protein